MSNIFNNKLRTALVQFFIRVFKHKIKQDRNRPEFDPTEFSENNSIQRELVDAFKERFGTKWIRLDQDIYFSIHLYYDTYHEKLKKSGFRSKK